MCFFYFLMGKIWDWRLGLFPIILMILLSLSPSSCAKKISAVASKNLGKITIFVLGCYAFTIANLPFLTEWSDKANQKHEIVIEYITILLLGIGGIVAIWGLVIANKRQKTFSTQVGKQAEQIEALADQVSTQKEQLFGETLSQGVNLLSNEDSVAMRCAGIRILESLANSTEKNSRQSMQVIRILHDFLSERAKAQYQMDDNGMIDPAPITGEPEIIPKKRYENRFDIALAVKTIALLLAKNSLHVRDMENPFNDLDLRGLDFSWFECNRVNFTGAQLQGARFDHAILREANFNNANVKQANFMFAILPKANFSGLILEETKFNSAELYFADFSNSTVRETLFTNAKLKAADFSDAHLGGKSGLKEWQLKDIIFLVGHMPVGDNGVPNNRAYDYAQKIDNFGSYKIFADSKISVEEQFHYEIAAMEHEMDMALNEE